MIDLVSWYVYMHDMFLVTNNKFWWKNTAVGLSENQIQQLLEPVVRLESCSSRSLVIIIIICLKIS